MPDWQDKLARIAQRNRQEIIHAKLSRREMMRLGLLTSAGTLVLKSGLSSRVALADGGGSPASPAHTPWAMPLPILQTRVPVTHDQLRGGHCTGFTPVDGATK